MNAERVGEGPPQLGAFNDAIRENSVAGPVRARDADR